MARKLRWGALAAAVAALGASCTRSTGTGSASEALLAAPGELVLHVAPVEQSSVTASEIPTLAGIASLEVKISIPELGAYVLGVPPGTEASAIAQLSKRPWVDYVTFNYLATHAQVPNDPDYARQWHLQTVAAADAWDATTGDPGAPVAVIDTGVDGTHPDLANRLIPGWNFVTGTGDTQDTFGHGTAVAGVLAAASDNGLGVSGLLWQNPILPLAVTSPNGLSSYASIAQAIVYAISHNVRVINISMGGTAPSALLDSAVQYAWDHNALVFAAAMNDGLTVPHYPAASPHALGITSIGIAGKISGFSAYGAWVSFAAPGELILTTSLGGSYGEYEGTSFATPIASGSAALVLAARPDLANSDVIAILKNSAVADTPGVFDPQYGYGRIDVGQAVAAAQVYPRPSSTPVLPSVMELGATGAQTVNSQLYSVDLHAPNTVVFDSQGGIFLGGSTQGSFGGRMIGTSSPGGAFIAKVGPNNAVLWTTELASASTSEFHVDSVGNLILCGSASAPLGGTIVPPAALTYDFVAKFSNSGQLLWITELGADSTQSQVHGVCVVDPVGNVYIAGATAYFLGGNQIGPFPQQNGYLAKIGVGGQVLWTSQWGGVGAETAAEQLVLDSSGFAYVAGTSPAALGGKISGQLPGAMPYVIKFTPTGAISWATQLGVQNSATQITSDTRWLSVDPVTGDVLTLGVVKNPVQAPAFGSTFYGTHVVGDTNVFLARFASGDGSLKWVSQWGDGGTTAPEGAMIGPGGSVVVAEQSYLFNASNTALIYRDVTAMMIDATGAQVWSVQYGSSASSSNLFSTGLVLDSSGNSYLPFYGAVDASQPESLVYLAKISPTGAQLWQAPVGTATSNSFTQVGALSIDPASGDLLLAGMTFGALGGNLYGAGGSTTTPTLDPFLARFTSSGAQVWVTQFGALGAEALNNVLYQDPAGRPVLLGTLQYSQVGTLYGTHGTMDIYLARINRDGTLF